ncbi:hypothetical protein AAF712_005826 [Marasmius tenuissimus]|uniref:DUF6534 domain-containing protein n=1 Tax=Marasmius tenuissimus TaxID=585030 RepID=A0ABR3A129_9AGAR
MVEVRSGVLSQPATNATYAYLFISAQTSTDAQVSTAQGLILKLIGYFVNWGLYGVLCLQVFLYYLAFKRDKWVVKALVYGLLILDTVQTVLITYDVYIKYGLEYGNVAGLAVVRNGWLSIPIISALNATVVQLFFAYRIWKLSRSGILGIFVAVLAIAAGVGGVVTGIQAKIINNLGQVAVRARTALTIWLTITGACDVVIAVCMTVILSRKRFGFNDSTDDAITKIIRLTVETGTLTAILAMLTVILFCVFPNRSYWNIPMDMLGKLYSNNFMVILNRRIRMFGDNSDPTVPSTIITYANSTQLSGLSGRTQCASRRAHQVHREVWSKVGRDDDPDNIQLEDMAPKVSMPVFSYVVPARSWLS